MKTLKTLIKSVLVPLLILGCTDNLDQRSLSETEADFYTKRDDFDKTILNAYAKLTDFYWYAGGSFRQEMFHLSGDDITMDQDRFSAHELFTTEINANDGDIAYYWDRAYEVISKANVAIEKSSEADRDSFDEPEFLDWIQGEGLFLRGYIHWKLYNKFGSAPVIAERITTFEQANTPKSEGVELLDQAVSDFQEAITLLPDSWDANLAGRVTKNSARGMLIKALVFRGDYGGNTSDYQEAANILGSMSGAALTTDYTDNFNANTENNEESLFEFQASSAGFDNVWLYNDGPWGGVESMHAFWGIYTTEANGASNNNGGSTWRITSKLMASHGTDPRIAYFTEADRSFTKYGMTGLDWLNGSGVGSRNNPRLLRYADVILLAAEATIKSGGSAATAIGLVNQVRTRARNWDGGTEPADYSTSETDTNTILGWIYDERLVELAGEEDIRWFDLKRMHATGFINLASFDFSTDLSGDVNFDVSRNLVWPIPQVEIDRNSAIVANNPGF